MTNVEGAGASVAPIPGTTSRSSPRHERFAARLSVIASDAVGNPIEGVNAAFTLLTGAASPRFGPAYTGRSVAVPTAVDGIATPPDVRATNTAGTSQATATVAGNAASAQFKLTNAPVLPRDCRERDQSSRSYLDTCAETWRKARRIEEWRCRAAAISRSGKRRPGG